MVSYGRVHLLDTAKPIIAIRLILSSQHIWFSINTIYEYCNANVLVID
jgi:hypothetical protein